jgi:putative two-component system response regulator
MNKSDQLQIILVVDDTPENIDLLRGMLNPQYKVKAATNGTKALQIAANIPQPDLILLDIMMPEMDGYEVCRLLKQDSHTAHIPVIFITAKTATEDEQHGLELGAVDYITKPFNPVIVETRVRTQLALYQQNRKLHVENLQLRERIAGGFSEFTEGELRELIDSGENTQLEFKSTLRWNLHTEKVDPKIENQSLKTVAAYLNSDDGILLVGVDDDGNAIGLGNDVFSNEDKMLLHWHSLIKSHLGLEFAHLIKSTFQDLDGKRVLIIQALRSDTPVFFRRGNDEVFFVRMGNTTHQLKPSEVIAYINQRMAGYP